jgi:hypothetical protein
MAMQPPPQSSNPTSAPDLPHELLVQIIHYAAPPLATDLKSQRRRRRPLRRYALVNKAWHGAALDEAAQHLFINLHEPGWAQNAELATLRILMAKTRAEERGRNVKTLAVFGQKGLPNSSADVLRTVFHHAQTMTLRNMKKPMRLLAGSDSTSLRFPVEYCGGRLLSRRTCPTVLTSLRLHEVRSPAFIGTYSVLKRLELIDCFPEAFVSSWLKVRFPVIETAVFRLKERRLDVPFQPPSLEEERPDTLRALAIAGPFSEVVFLDLDQQANLEHVHVGARMETARDFLSMCQPIKGTLSLDPNGAGVRPEFDWLQLNTWRLVAESPRFSRLKKLKLYNAIDPKADPWFSQFAEHLTRSQTGLDADFEYAVHTDRLSLTDWDPGQSRFPPMNHLSTQ